MDYPFLKVLIITCSPLVTVKNPPAIWGPGFDPWVGKNPWRRAWQPTPVFLPGESWTEEAGGLPWGCKEQHD